MAQRVKDVMTSGPLVAEPRATVAEVARMMKENDVGAIVVQSEAGVRGLVTDRDIVVRAVADGRDGARTSVDEICSGEVHTVSPDEPLDTAIETMRRYSVRRLPVVDDGHAVGIVSIGDLAMERDERSALADISAAPPNR